ncbi:MAG: NfeD family protein [Caulobacteraceae bacterium]
MTTLQALYQQEPFWVWLAAGACLAALSQASGIGLLFWASLAAGALACLELTGLRLGGFVELLLFAALAAGSAMLARRLPKPVSRPRPVQLDQPGPSAPRPAHTPKPPPPSPPASPAPEPAIRVGSKEHSARLIGRIARTTGQFANGVGRVWIDGAEWAAELGSGEEDLAPDTPVRVTRVVGAVRLQVCTLS